MWCENQARHTLPTPGAREGSLQIPRGPVDWSRGRRPVASRLLGRAPCPHPRLAFVVRPRVHDAGPGETIVVPIDATLMGLRAAPNPALSLDGRLRPRVRSGWALKRLAADEGVERFVLRDLEGGAFVRMDADDAALFELLDGNRTVAELLTEAERVVGPAGPGRLARLIADLADRGLLDGVGAAPATAPEPEGALARILKPRDKTVTWVGDYFERAYHHWGHVFFSPLTVTFLALFALAGFGAFAYIVGARFGTPFVVANRLAIGGAVFVAGRFALVAVHELAHGLALAHYGRRAYRLRRQHFAVASVGRAAFRGVWVC